MEERLKQCYENIFERCKLALPIEWTEVKIWAEKYDQEGSYNYHELLNYKDTQGIWHRSCEIRHEFSDEIDLEFCKKIPTKPIDEIYRIFIENGMEIFKVFTYTVDVDGHFEVNFQYEYSEGKDFLERMTLWEYETIGYFASDYDKKVIKKYHPEFEG